MKFSPLLNGYCIWGQDNIKTFKINSKEAILIYNSLFGRFSSSKKLDIIFNSDNSLELALRCNDISEFLDKTLILPSSKMEPYFYHFGETIFYSINLPEKFDSIVFISTRFGNKLVNDNRLYLLINETYFENDINKLISIEEYISRVVSNNNHEKFEYCTKNTLTTAFLAMNCFYHKPKINLQFMRDLTGENLKKYSGKFIFLKRKEKSYLLSISDLSYYEINSLIDLENILGKIGDEHKYTIS